jgi:hypothetical protein
MLGASAKVLALLLTSTAVFIVASKRHNEAHEKNQFDSHAQCGHWVFYRSSQLLGYDIGKQQLASLPMRDAGMTVRELADGLKRVGFGVEVRLGEYHVEQDRIAVLKLNSPNHFVVVSRGVDGRLQYHVDYKAVVEGESKNIDTRYSGVWLEVTRPKIERSSGPGISFNTLVIDTGVLEFYEHLGKTPWFTFEVTNHGDKPLKIENVQVGCDCVRVEWPKDEIAIEEVVEIRAQYIPKISKDNGFFQQHFVVTSNDPKRPFVTLEVSGVFRGRVEVYPAKIDLEYVRPSQVFKRHILVDLPIGHQFNDGMVFRQQMPERWAIVCNHISLDEYNAAVGAGSAGFVPINDSPSIVAYELEIERLSNESGAFLDTLEFVDVQNGNVHGGVAIQGYFLSNEP